MATEITVYTYHNHPPFITGKNSGLTYDLVNILEKELPSYDFKVKVVPRKRLNVMLKPWINKKCYDSGCDKNWMLPWVNQVWGFGKDSRTNFSWNALFEDANVIVSNINNKIDYKEPASLIGKKFAGIGGHRYLGIDALAKEKKLQRINGTNEKKNLLKLLEGRVDATLLPKSTMMYILKNNTRFDGKFFIAPTVHQSYERNIMSPSNNKALFNALQKVNLANNASFQSLVN